MKKALLERLVLALLLLGEGEIGAQQRRTIDFLNERLVIPESERFREADYTESGVGLTFGVDKRLSYYTANYEEAAQRFEVAVRGYRYKSEIWVYLARAHFYMKDPEQARQTIEQAARTMPDLQERFWNPLLLSLLDEIRKRAHNLQTQVDFYSKSQGDFLSLFRLYKFLDDHKGAAGVITSAQAKSVRMSELATMVSGQSQRAYRVESGKWMALADELRTELEGMGGEPPPRIEADSAAVSELRGRDPTLLEQTRVLQLKVDYYPSEMADFRKLFDNYVQLDMPELAAGVVESLGREMDRVNVLADIAIDFGEEEKYRQQLTELEALRREFQQQLAGGP